MIPKELLTYRQWVLWRYETVSGRVTKIPYSVKGFKASVTNPKDWSDWETVNSMRQYYDGIGFVFTSEDPFIGIDWDHCLDYDKGIFSPSEIEKEIFALESYAEVSPSGTGVHAIIRGVLPRVKSRGNGREIYSQGRFFTVTGHWMAGTPLEIKAPPIEALNNVIKAIAPVEPVDVVHFEFDSVDNIDIKARHVIDKLRDNQLFRRLVNGAWHGEFKSQSEADFRLCCMLARYTDSPSIIDYIFRRTKLYRLKWDDKYGRMTIDAALTSQLVYEIARELT